MITCWLHQWRLSRRIDGDDAVPESTEQHMERCAACRAAASTLHAVDRALAQERKRPELPPFLHDRILNALDTPPVPSPHARVWWARPTPVATLAVLLLVGLVVSGLQRGNAPGRDGPVTVIGLPAIDIEVASIDQWATSPYSDELDNLASDIEGSANFLLDCTMVSLSQ